MSRLFRKVALQRLTTPEQLDQMITVTEFKGWLVLLGLCLLLVLGVAWGVAGRIALVASGHGVLVQAARETGPDLLEAHLFLPAAQMAGVRVGMPVSLTPEHARPGRDGYLTGRVTALAEAPIAREALIAQLGDADRADELLRQGVAFPIVVTLQPSTDGTGYVWTRPGEGRPPLYPGIRCRGMIEVGARKPWTLMLPGAEEGGS